MLYEPLPDSLLQEPTFKILLPSCSYLGEVDGNHFCCSSLGRVKIIFPFVCSRVCVCDSKPFFLTLRFEGLTIPSLHNFVGDVADGILFSLV